MKKTLIAMTIALTLTSGLFAHEFSVEADWLPTSASVDWSDPTKNVYNKSAGLPKSASMDPTKNVYVNSDDLFRVDLSGRFDLPFGFFVAGDCQGYALDSVFADGSIGLGWKHEWLTVSAERAWYGSVDSLGYAMEIPFLSKNSAVAKVSARGDWSLALFDGIPSKSFAEVGWLPLSGVNVNWNKANKATWVNRDDAFYVDLGLKLGLPLGFFVDGCSKTWMLKPTYDFTFSPFFTSYSVGFGWEKGWFSVGLEHTCSHSIYPNGHKAKAPAVGKDASLDKVWVKATFKL